MPNRSKSYDAPLAAGFPARLLDARKGAKLSQQELGVAIGYSARSARQAINGLEKARFRGSIDVAEAIARVLRVNAAWLAYGKGARRARASL